MYEIEPLTAIPERTRITRKLKYPFNELIVGTSFTVPAEMADQFRHVRASASDYARRYDVRIRCCVQANGTLLVWREMNEAEKIAAVNVQHPTKFEFVAYLAAMKVNQSLTLKQDLSERFEQLIDWLLEYAAESGSTFTHNATETELEIIRS